MKDFFVKKTNVEVIRDIRKLEDPVTAKDVSISVSRSTQTVYNKLNSLEDLDLITKDMETNGRKPLRLTDDGKELAREFERLYRVFDEVEKPVKSGKEGDTE